jgi:hypothetical protein
MSMSRCAHRERGASARGSFDFGRTDTTSCTERSNGDQESKSAREAKAWGGQPRERYDRCYHDACDTIDNVNRDVLKHYLRAIAGTVAYFATSTADLR